MSEYRVSESASRDLHEIWLYIARDNPDAADRVIESIVGRFPFLAEQRRVGQLRDDLLPGMRLFPAGKYIIFFRETDERVEIVRVLSGRRDFEAIFRSSTPESS